MKKKKQNVAGVAGELLDGDNLSSNAPSPTMSEQDVAPTVKVPIFKNPNFVHSNRAASKKNRAWKSLKQVIYSEKVLPWRPDDATYASIDAPPSFKPAKKYSDISGLPAKYTDPHTKIRYATTDEYSRIRILPSDIATGYLALRRANVAVP